MTTDLRSNDGKNAGTRLVPGTKVSRPGLSKATQALREAIPSPAAGGGFA